MATRQRISFSPASASSGGGGGTIVGDVGWGPDFGEAGTLGSTWQVGVNPDLDAVDASIPLNVGVNLDLDAVDISGYSAGNVGVNLDLDDVGYSYELVNVGVKPILTDVSVTDYPAGNVGVNVDLDAVDISDYSAGNVGVNVDLDDVSLSSDGKLNVGTLFQLTDVSPTYGPILNVGVNLDLTAVDVDATVLNVGVTPDLDDVSLSSDGKVNVGVLATLTDVSPTYEPIINVGVNVDLTAVDFSSTTNNVGANIYGEILGAPFWQDVATQTRNNAGDLVVTSGTNIPMQENDLLVAFACANAPAGVGDVTPPAPGWTEFVTSPTIGTLRARAWYHTVTAAEGTTETYTFTATSASVTGATLEVHQIRGGTPAAGGSENNSATLASSALDPDPDGPSVTPSEANSLIIAWLGHDHLALNQTHTPLTSWSERTDFQAGTGVFVSSCSQSRVRPAGATGTLAFNCTETVATDAVMITATIEPVTFVLTP